MAQERKALEYAAFVLLCLLFVGSLTWFNGDSVKVETKQVDLSGVATKDDLADVDKKLDNLSGDVTLKLTSLELNLDEDDQWKDQAIGLATEEWSRSDYRDVYRALSNIDEKEDISKVVVKDNEVTGLDSDDQDAKVVQEVKVYYEDLSGDDVKTYLIITTCIKDGEVTSQEIELR